MTWLEDFKPETSLKGIPGFLGNASDLIIILDLYGKQAQWYHLDTPLKRC